MGTIQHWSIEGNSGNMEQAVKHWTITATGGQYNAMHHLITVFKQCIVMRINRPNLTAYKRDVPRDEYPIYRKENNLKFLMIKSDHFESVRT
jgi:hypothetical protein